MLEALVEAALRSSALTAVVWAILRMLRLRDPRGKVVKVAARIP